MGGVSSSETFGNNTSYLLPPTDDYAVHLLRTIDDGILTFYKLESQEDKQKLHKLLNQVEPIAVIALHEDNSKKLIAVPGDTCPTLFIVQALGKNYKYIEWEKLPDGQGVFLRRLFNVCGGAGSLGVNPNVRLVTDGNLTMMYTRKRSALLMAEKQQSSMNR